MPPFTLSVLGIEKKRAYIGFRVEGPDSSKPCLGARKLQGGPRLPDERLFEHWALCRIQKPPNLGCEAISFFVLNQEFNSAAGFRLRIWCLASLPHRT